MENKIKNTSTNNSNQDLGSTLRSARLATGMDLSQLATKTKIQKKYLRDLESNKFNLIPSSFHIKAFIETYCKAVNLNINELNIDWNLLKSQAVETVPSTNSANMFSDLTVRLKQSKYGDGEKPRKIKQNILRTSVVLGIILVLFAFWLLLAKIQHPDTQSSSSQLSLSTIIVNADKDKGN